MRIERIFALIAFCFTCLLIFINLFSLGESERVLSQTLSFYMLVSNALIFLLIIFNVKFLFLFVFVFYYNGLFSIADGEGVVGIIFIFFSLCLGFKYGFFMKQKRLKIYICILFLVLAISIQFIKLPTLFRKNTFEILLLSLVFTMLYLIFKDDLRRYFQRRPKYHLSHYGLSPKESIYLIAFIQGQSMKEIAADYHVDLSTVKTGLHRAYQKLNVPDCKTFIIKTKDMDVVP